MNHNRSVLLGSAALLTLVAACSSSGGSTSSPPSPSSSSASASPSSAVAGAPAVKISEKSGHLVAPDGRTLYILTSDTARQLACSGGCLTNWPPLAGRGTAGSGVSGALATVARGSSTQVTYRGYPLYEFAGDSKPGDTKGNGSEAFGGTWEVAQASASASPSAAASSAVSAGAGGYGR